MRTVIALLAGAGFGSGLWLIASGWRRHPSTPPTSPSGRAGWVAGLPAAVPKLAAGLTIGVLVGVVTGWPAAGLLTAFAVAGLPTLLGPDRDHQRALEKVEAIAAWTELLRDTLAAAAGVQQTIIATAATAPEPIGAQVRELAAGLRDGIGLAPALRRFADQLADPTADLVVAALLLAADRPSANLGPLLGELAVTARGQAAMRQRISASRARLRTSSRIITAITVAMVVALVALNRPWMAAYDSPAGQLVMLAAGGMFAAGLLMLKRMAHLPPPPRILSTTAGGGERP
jgi:Flp pilus assembly protein TadB